MAGSNGSSPGLELTPPMASVFEKVYPFAPVWAQNLAISAYGLGWRKERLGGDFESHVAGYRERDRWPADRMREYVDARLRGVLLHSFDQVPYYRRKWTEAGLCRADIERMTASTLTELPVTPKADLRQFPEQFIAESYCGKQLKEQKTSGSTGTPIVAVCTADEHRQFIAVREVRSLGWAGTSIKDPRSMIGGRMVVPKATSDAPYHRYNLAERQVYFSAYHISPSTVAAYVAAWDKYRPSLLTGYAHSHFSLARMMAEQGLRLDYEPRALVLSSEKLTEEMKRVIAGSFRARAYEEYAAVENCALATECEAGSLHASQDFGITEIVDAANQAVEPGEEGRVLCTSLVKLSQPLIRYEIGDAASWSKERCACGRDHLPVLREVMGRLEDVVVGPDGREMVRFHGIFVALPHVAEAQVIQETLDRLTIKLVPTSGYGVADETLIRQRINDRLPGVRVDIEMVASIPRSERGKFRAVVSRLTPAERDRHRLMRSNSPVSSHV